MAQTIKLKRSATAGAEPTTSQLELGEVAINTYDGKMYIKKSVGGTESIVEISGAGGAEAIFVEYLYTATASQTAFSGNDDNSAFLSYEVGAIQVFLNGILLDPETDYTATNGALITLASAAAVDDYLQIFAFKKKISDGNVTVDTFSGNNSTTAFTLTLDPGDENNTRVFIDGVYQSKSNYTVSGTTLTFSTAPPSGTAIEVEIGNRVVTLDTLSDLDLPDNVKLRLGTSQDLEIYHNATDSVINQTGTGDLLIQKDETTVAEFNVEGLTVTGSVEADEFIGDVRGAVLFKAQAGESLAKGEVVYISGISGNTTIVSKADADDASKMPAFGLVAAAASSGNPVDIYTNGILSGIDTSSYSEGDELFVSTTAGALTATPPTGESSALQKIGKVTRSASNGSIFIVGAGRSNAVSNLDDGDIFIGNSSNQAVSASLNTKIESYLDGGTSTPTFSTINSGNITTTGELRGPASFTIDPAAVGDNTGTVIIKGNLQVDGATTTINSTTLTVDDLNLTLASGAANGTAANGAGITIDGASATLTYQSTGDNWAFNKNLDVTGNIVVSGTVDGRDVATDGTKLDTIEPSSTADQTGAEIKALYEAETNAYTDTLNTKLNAIEALADVTDTTNVTAAGALMDSEVTNLAQVKAFDSSDYATAAQGTTADAALPKAGGTMTGTLAMGANAITSTGTISSGAITSSGAIISTDSGNRLDALSIGDDSDIYLYEGSTNVLNIRTGASGSYKYFTFQDDGYFNTNSGGISTGGTARITSTGNLTNIGTISSGGITSSSGITATGPFKSGGSNNYILFDYDGDFTGGNYYAIQDTSANRLRISYGFSATDNLELDASGNFYVNGGNATFAGTTSSTGLVLNGGRTAEGVTAAGTYAELTRASGGDLGLLFNKDTSKWLIGIDNSDGNAANLRFMYGAYNASIHPGFGSDYSGLNLTYQGRVGVGTRYPGAELEVAGTALVENAKLKAIAESNTDTAVDVFVYDTRKDSDGGAWRKRTQNTSWYNETLNTSYSWSKKRIS